MLIVSSEDEGREIIEVDGELLGEGVKIVIAPEPDVDSDIGGGGDALDDFVHGRVQLTRGPVLLYPSADVVEVVEELDAGVAIVGPLVVEERGLVD